jgi:hypothetical protein
MDHAARVLEVERAYRKMWQDFIFGLQG